MARRIESKLYPLKHYLVITGVIIGLVGVAILVGYIWLWGLCLPYEEDILVGGSRFV